MPTGAARAGRGYKGHRLSNQDAGHQDVGFSLSDANGKTWLEFRHTGWPHANQHYRISCHCWAMYLRVLRRSLEHGETVPYEQRLDV